VELAGVSVSGEVAASRFPRKFSSDSNFKGGTQIANVPPFLVAGKPSLSSFDLPKELRRAAEPA